METLNESNGPTLFDPTSFAEATPANPSAPPAKGKGKKTRATSGRGYDTPLAFYDPVTRSLRMYEVTCLLAELPSLAKLPPSGILRNGVLYLRPPWEPTTAATESSLLHTPTGKMNQMSPSMADGKRLSGWWPTPTAVTRPMDGNVRLYRAKIEAGEMTEEEATAILGKSPYEAQGKIPAMWPTARASAAMAEDLNNVAARMEAGEPYKSKLEQAVALWPTPRAGSMCGGTGAANQIEEKYSDGTITNEERQAMRAGNGGKLNPEWVEWLMGFPTGWTDLKDSETPSSHKSPK